MTCHLAEGHIDYTKMWPGVVNSALGRAQNFEFLGHGIWQDLSLSLYSNLGRQPVHMSLEFLRPRPCPIDILELLGEEGADADTNVDVVVVLVSSVVSKDTVNKCIVKILRTDSAWATVVKEALSASASAVNILTGPGM